MVCLNEWEGLIKESENLILTKGSFFNFIKTKHQK